nr:hypothetical protein [Anaerolineae bacterium]
MQNQLESVIEDKEWRWVIISSALLLLIISVPFIIAYGTAIPDSIFMGVLVNPVDGASYQAKMEQGMNYSWLYHLPYTPEPHRGVALFTFYIGMGHMARILNVPPILVFHAMRLIGSMLMFLALYQLIADWTDDVTQRQITWSLAVASSGLGWVAIIFGHRAPPDLLILPEAFPLQAAYANPHFPWAIALAAWMVHILLTMPCSQPQPTLNIYSITLAFATVMLTSFSPFVLLPIGLAYGAMLVWLWIRQRALPRSELAWGLIVLLSALPLILYNAWAISKANPVFNAWMEQNTTPSPPVWDYLIAFGPLLVLAVVGISVSLRSLDGENVFLLGWLAAIFVLLYLPFSLQRRFSMGITIPLAIFAGRGLWRVIIPSMSRRWRVLTISAAILIFMPTTVLAITLPLYGAVEEKDEYFYITLEERDAMEWLSDHTDGDAPVLASDSLSLFLPLWDQPVVYAHPFETLQAANRQKAVEDFFSGVNCDVVESEGVGYVIISPRERRMAQSGQTCPIPGELVYQSDQGEVLVYAITN